MTMTSTALQETNNMLAEINGRQRLRIAELEAALKSISVMRYGVDGTESDEEALKYWSGLALGYRNIARAALSPATQDKKEA